MADYNKIINDLRMLVEKNTRDISVLNEILEVREVPSDGFLLFKFSIDEISDETEAGLNAEDLVSIELFDENGNKITDEQGVVFTYGNSYIKVLFEDAHNVRRLGVKSKQQTSNIANVFSLYASNNGKSFVKLSSYEDGEELLIYNNFVYFDVPQYTKHESIIDTLKKESGYINDYETVADYESDTFRETPSVSYIEETDETIIDTNVKK